MTPAEWIARWRGPESMTGRSSEDEDLIRIPADGSDVVAHVRPRVAAAIMERCSDAVREIRETIADGRVIGVRLNLDPERVRSAEKMVTAPREMSTEQRAAAADRLQAARGGR